MAGPLAWLQEQGFDPEGNLCAAIVSDEEYPEDRGSPIKQTAMCAAAAEGELGSAASSGRTVRPRPFAPRTAGARPRCTERVKTATSIRPSGSLMWEPVRTFLPRMAVTKLRFSFQPLGQYQSAPCKSLRVFALFFSCYVSRGALSVSAVGVVCNMVVGAPPVSVLVTCASAGNHDVAKWLILQGGAHKDNEQVDKRATLQMQASVHHEDHPFTDTTIIDSLQQLTNEHANFTFIVLTAARFDGTSPSSWHFALQAAVGALFDYSGTATKKLRASASQSCKLGMLRGHEGSLLRLIADFTGVVRGRQLRRAREVLRALIRAEDCLERLM